MNILVAELIWPEGLDELEASGRVAYDSDLRRDPQLDYGLSPRIVELIHTTPHKALKQAVRWALVPRNVADAATAPRPTKKEKRPFTPDQARALLEAASGDRFEALYVLAITAGLRRGELLGLRWQDVDLERGSLQVRQQLVRTKKDGLSFTSPKGGGSRGLKLIQGAIDALKNHRKRQNEERLRLGTLWQNTGLVFTTVTGTPMDGDNLAKRSFGPLLTRGGLPRIRFHDLRHTFATLWLESGEHPKILQEILGHSRISITLASYSHVAPHMQREAMGRFGRMFSKSS